jgi:lipoprotein-releasing system permease protein
MIFYLAKKLSSPKGANKGFLRYARSLSILGIAIGTAGLMIALSIVHGFKETITDKILDFGAPITVTTYSTDPLFRADTLVTWLATIDGVNSAWPVIENQIVVQVGDQVQGAIIQGLDYRDRTLNLPNYLVAGKWFTENEPGVVVGEKLARLLGLSVGDKCTMYALISGGGPLGNPKVVQLPLVGIYKTGIDRFDDVSLFLPIESARKLSNLAPEQASRVQITIADKSKISATNNRLSEAVPFPYFTESVFERFSDLFSWIDLQEVIIPPVISVLILVAAFNLIGAILMVVLEKSRHIGILITLGLERKAIQQLFIVQALWLSFLGWAIGMSLFLLFHWTQTQFQWIPLDSVNYFMDYAPSSPAWTDFFIVSIVTAILSVLAGWIPSRIAAKTDVIRVLRFSQI